MLANLEIIGRKKSGLIIRNLNIKSTRKYTKDYYEVLDVKKNASRREIKQAYYRLSKKYHPDLHPDVKTAEEKFKALQEAYNILGDEKKRLEYDFSLNEGFYPGESQSQSTENEPGFTARTYKKRNSNIYTGKTSTYDFDEYYKSHYGSNIKRPPHMSGFARQTTTSSKNLNEEELKKYWNTKDFSEEDYFTKTRNEYFYRSILILAGLVIMYFFLKKVKDSEEEAGRKTYNHNLQEDYNKKKL